MLNATLLTRPTISVIRRACKQSRLAYLSSECTADETDILLTDEATCAQALVARDGDVTYVAFRGTSSAVDWRMNARVWLVPSTLHPSAMVHAGFCGQWLSLKKDVMTVLEGYKSNRIILTGHSLAGGVATVSCTEIADRFPKAHVQVVTFGGPRPGNAAFGRAVHARVPDMVRVVHDNDIVPSLPGSFMGYSHATCQLLHLHGEGRHTTFELKRPWWRALGGWTLRLLTLNAGVRDHDIEKYEEELKWITDNQARA